jgi:hypothetical protein
LCLLSIVEIDGADQSKVFTSADGRHRLTYAERLPAKPASSRLGLILLFHGNTLNETSLFGPTQAALEQAGIADEWVVIGLKSQAAGWGNADDAPVAAFTEHALDTYPVDRRRVIGMGYSSGTYFITRFAQARSDLFAGAIGYVGSQSGAPTRADPATVAELYWVTGHRDTLQPVKEPRVAAARNLELGLPVIYREERGMGHDFLWGPTGVEALAWMQTLRVKPLAPAGEEAVFLDGFADEAKAKRLLGDARTWARVVAIGGPPVAPLILRGLASDKPTVQANAAVACTQVQIDEAITTALAALLTGKDKKLKAAALDALVRHATWNRQPAQRVLCDLVLATTTPLADRRAITLGLAQVVKPDLLGALFYHRVRWTLVDLLDDADAGLRSGAFAALEPSGTGGFGYQPGANQAARAAALAQWRDWSQQCGARPVP